MYQKDKIIQLIADNLDRIQEYIKEHKWSVNDLKQRKWSKQLNNNHNYLGKQKNNEGKCINCNGVCIDANWDIVLISTFDENGKATWPYIMIDEDNFEIRK